MKKFYPVAIIALLLFTGCTNSGAFLAANQTIVNLNEGNYSIAATNVTGESSAAYIFGLSFSTGLAAATVAIARVEGSEYMYAEAIANLWENYEAENGPVTNESLALTNVRFDADILNLIVYSKVNITVRADIIEFD